VKLADAIKTARGLKLSHAQKFAQHVVPEVVRPARIIWNQAIGGVFLFFAVLFFGTTLRYFDSKTGVIHNPVGLAFSIFLGLVMAFFGLTSFLKARRIGRRLR
jgi:ABC-type dipeptide/oligopeptide/nickel transport system permease subunit